MSKHKVYDAKIHISVTLTQSPREGYGNHNTIEFDFSEKAPEGLDPVAYMQSRFSEEINRALRNRNLLPWSEPIESVETPTVEPKDNDIPF